MGRRSLSLCWGSEELGTPGPLCKGVSDLFLKAELFSKWKISEGSHDLEMTGEERERTGSGRGGGTSPPLIQGPCVQVGENGG